MEKSLKTIFRPTGNFRISFFWISKVFQRNVLLLLLNMSVLLNISNIKDFSDLCFSFLKILLKNLNPEEGLLNLFLQKPIRLLNLAKQCKNRSLNHFFLYEYSCNLYFLYRNYKIQQLYKMYMCNSELTNINVKLN